MTDQRATQAARAGTEPRVAQVATPTAVPATTGPRPAQRPVDAISLALAAAIAEIVARRAASVVSG